MSESENMEQLIIERVESCVELINLKHPSFTMNVPNISFDLEGKILGQAKYSNWTLSFNLKFAVHHKEDYLKITIPHEVAHLADYQYYKKWGHGRTWKYIMLSVFGLDPKRCSNLELPPDVKKNKMNTFIYTCACPGKEIEIGMRRHKIISTGRYASCVTCRTRIQFKKFVGKI